MSNDFLAEVSEVMLQTRRVLEPLALFMRKGCHPPGRTRPPVFVHFFQPGERFFHFRFQRKPVASNVLCPTSPFSTSRTCGMTPKWRSSTPSPASYTARTSLVLTCALRI